MVPVLSLGLKRPGVLPLSQRFLPSFYDQPKVGGRDHGEEASGLNHGHPTSDVVT